MISIIIIHLLWQQDSRNCNLSSTYFRDLDQDIIWSSSQNKDPVYEMCLIGIYQKIKMMWPCSPTWCCGLINFVPRYTLLTTVMPFWHRFQANRVEMPTKKFKMSQSCFEMSDLLISNIFNNVLKVSKLRCSFYIFTPIQYLCNGI